MRWLAKNFSLIVKTIGAVTSLGIVVSIFWWGNKTQDHDGTIQALTAQVEILTVINQLAHANSMLSTGAVKDEELAVQLGLLQSAVKTFNVKHRQQLKECAK